MELKAYITPLLKWWWLLLAATGVATVSSYLAVRQQPAIYQAKSTLLIGNAIENPNPTGNEFWLGQQLAQTYTDIGQRTVVKEATMSALGLTWLPEYTVRTLPNTQLIEIAVTDTSPERAMVVANELANQLIFRTPTSIRRQEDQERQTFINLQLDELQVKIKETQDEITTKQEELGELFSARQIADTQSQIAALETKLDTLQSNYAALLTSTEKGAINSLSIMEPATIPAIPIGPDTLMTIIAAAAIGLSLAGGAAYLLEYLDDTLKTPEDVEHVVRLPTLAGIATVKSSKDGERPPLITVSHPRSPISEAYRTLRTGILFANVDKKCRSILVTSANPGEGKSVTAANLSIVMAQAGHNVLLIDADLRRPVQHKIFELSKNNGLTDLLLAFDATNKDEATDKLLKDAIKQTGQPGLFVLTCGAVPPNPSELVGSTKMRVLLDRMLTQFDYVIFDTPPCLAVTDAVVLSTIVDGSLLVSHAGRTRRNQIKQTVERLQEVQANILGLTLNRLTARTGGYYYYYYYNKNSYYTDDATASLQASQNEMPLEKSNGIPKHAKKKIFIKERR
ncbi:MAG: polysaccharide biosynthesis tyrosine autokinase [Anaerolineales bacterium]|nr:polysaccharide biosynthesis tyrosine autokinase [Anaerolineales bacterium]